jgi:hypothetical protein
MSNYVSTIPSLTKDSWVGVPSRRHWEALRKMVLSRAVGEITVMLRRARHSRRANGWRPCSATELAAAEQGVREVMYLLDAEVLSNMKMWAMERAASGQWRVPSANIHNGITTRDVALSLLSLDHERGYTSAVEEKDRLSDAPCCWEEGIVGSDFCRQTEILCDKIVYSFVNLG